MGPGGKLGALILALTVAGILFHGGMRILGRNGMKEQ